MPLAARAIISPVPAPTNERQSLEHELREELPAQLAAYKSELESEELATGPTDWVRREVSRDDPAPALFKYSKRVHAE